VPTDRRLTRRTVLRQVGVLAVGSPAFAHWGAARLSTPAAGEAGVSAIEDLMREHGVLARVLLVYEACLPRLTSHHDTAATAEAIHSAAGIVRRFIEEYHEKLEEDRIFPRFEQAGQLVELTRTLRAQHEAGRTLTQRILGVAPANLREAAPAIQAFRRMYRPHKAFEDTVLFPALHSLLSPDELDELGDEFEEQEHRLLGEGGFEGTVAQVAQLEVQVGIHDLAQFTPTD
jgi:hemerythrin-like domain-containing protein